MLWGMLIWISTSSSGVGDFVHCICMNVERRRSPEWLRRHRPAGWPPCITMPQRRPAANRRLGLRPPSPAPLHSSTVAAAYSPMEPAVVPARFPPPRRRHEARNRTAEGKMEGKEEELRRRRRTLISAEFVAQAHVCFLTIHKSRPKLHPRLNRKLAGSTTFYCVRYNFEH